MSDFVVDSADAALHASAAGSSSSLPVVEIRDGGIRLGQFVKLASLVETGGEAKEAVVGGRVGVNGVVDVRRGRRLRPGDVVTIVADGQVAGAVVGLGDVEDDFFDEATADDGFDPQAWLAKYEAEQAAGVGKVQ